MALFRFLKKVFSPKDMTTGEPWKRILLFALPMLIGNFAQQLYNTVDTIVVGHYVGDNALAAVGSSGPVINILLAIFIGISAGAGILVAQQFGAKRREDLSRTIGNCLSLTAIAVVIIAVLGPFAIRPLLSLMNTPAEIIEMSTSYLTISFRYVIGFFFFNIFSGILRGLGDTFSALLFLLISTGLNIVLDLYFVASLGLGVSGVAIATVISQTISAILCAIKLSLMRSTFDFGFKYMAIKKQYAGNIINLGIPSGITQALHTISLLIVQSLTNSFGTTVIAANVIVMRVDGFVMMPNFTFGMASSTYTAQNVGARKLERIELGMKQGLKMALGVSVVLTAIIFIFGKNLMTIFTDNLGLIDLSYYLMCFIAPMYIAMAVTNMLQGAIRGSGDTMTPMWITMISVFAVRVPLSYILAWITNKPYSIFISMTAMSVFSLIATIVCYNRKKWYRRCEERIRRD